jgi:penicillin-binding protein 1A
MQYAHQGIELKNLPGLRPNPASIAPAVAQSTKNGEAPHPAMLTYRGAQVLGQVERMMEEARHALPAEPVGPAAAIDRAPASDRRSANSPTGPFAAADERTRKTSGD